MQIAQAVGGFSLGQADQMRRAMGKKKLAEMEQMKVGFFEGARKQDIPDDVTQQIWDLLFKFASYGFNKSHSAAYAWLAYQTGYLKANYRAEFMAAVMTNDKDDTKKVVAYIEDCRKAGVQVLPPDINFSQDESAVDETGAIRFGLGAVKNVGHGAVENLIAGREAGGPYKDVFDLLERVDTRLVNRKVLESLIQVGALDSLDENRARLFANVEVLLVYAGQLAEQAARNQMNLFGGGGDTESSEMPKPRLSEVQPWSDFDRLGREKELIGFYVSGHPLEKYRSDIQQFSTGSLDRMGELNDNQSVRLCGMISDCRNIVTKRGKPMVLGNLEDFSGSMKFMAFDECLTKCRPYFQADAMVSLKGTLRNRGDDDLIVVVDDVIPLEDISSLLGNRLTISLQADKFQSTLLDPLEALLGEYNGPADVYFCLMKGEQPPLAFRSEKYKVGICNPLLEGLKDLLGETAVTVSG